jgi:hypothetical protein
MGLVPLLGTLMTGVSTSKEEIERLRALGRAKKVSLFLVLSECAWVNVNERMKTNGTLR